MTRIIFVFLFSGLLCINSGCNRQSEISLPQQPESKTSLKQAPFPDFLVGIWKCGTDPNQYTWGFKFEKDGTISAMRNFLNLRIEVSEGSVYEQAADANVGWASTLGPVEVNYDPNGRILMVKVVTDYFMFRIYAQMLEGNSVDTFTGPVSQDGLTWTAEWRSVSRMLDGPPLDFNNPSIYPVVFYKVQEVNQPSKGN